MKQTIILLLICVFVSGCEAQKKKTPSKNTKIEIPIAPPDSLKAWRAAGEIGLWISSWGPPTYFMHNGKEWRDTTGLAVHKRKKLIGDTVIVDIYHDTSYAVISVVIGKEILKMNVLKASVDTRYMTWGLYEDTLTKERFRGNMGRGQVRDMDYQPPHHFITLSKTPLPPDVIVIGEIKK
jgi:hypothetical protein